ncbi:MAG: peptidoglycan-binding protein, partial [Sodaliphilus sp.]|nr:peptidoglycan-binding protein [Sodaliphilus sp.]
TNIVTESEEYNMPTIKKGSKGRAVKIWQIIIGATVDGVFGSGTEKATKSWQSTHGLSADGIVGKKSWEAGLDSV